MNLIMHQFRNLFIFLCFLSITLIFNNYAHCSESISKQNYLHLLETNGTPSQALLDLLARLGVRHDNSLSDIVAQTQKSWLRPPTKERFQLNETQAILK